MTHKKIHACAGKTPTSKEVYGALLAGHQQQAATNQLPPKQMQMVDGWIKEMQEAGLSPDDMLSVIAAAKQKFQELKKRI